MIRPNLFIVGAMKSGTTSLHQYLAQHPDVFMSEPKEPGFFVEELTWPRGAGWYATLFADAGAAQVVGESSTHYAKLPTYRGVPERIHAFNPEARLVYVMRDPLERLQSHYWHNVRNLHLEAERRPFERAVQEEPAYVAYGDYAMQLEAYLARFPRSQLYLLTFEELTRDPAATVGALCRWLGLAGDVPATAFARRWNARPDVVLRARGTGLLNRLRYSRWWDRLAPRVPKALRRVGTSLAEVPVEPDRAATSRTLARLRPWYRERTAALEALLGRSFPEWVTLYADD